MLRLTHFLRSCDFRNSAVFVPRNGRLTAKNIKNGRIAWVYIYPNLKG
jgi:hypothetical protein